MNISPRQYRPLSKEIRTKAVLRPTIEPVSPKDFLGYLKLQMGAIEATVIDDKVRAARKSVEKFSRHAIVNQTWDLFTELPPGTFPYFGMTSSIFARYFGYQPEGMEIPYPPLLGVLGIYSTDESGTETQVDPSVYWVSRADDPGRIAQKIDAFWPDTTGRAFECFRLRFVAGFLTPFTATANSAVISAPNHCYNVGDALVVTNRDGNLPSGFVDKQNYYVVASDFVAGTGVAGSTLQLSATSGGSPIAPTDIGDGYQFLGEMPDPMRRAILAAAGEDRYGKKDPNAEGEALPELAQSYLWEYRDIRI